MTIVQSWPLDRDLWRDDVTFLGVPLAEMCNQSFGEPRERILMKNIAYVGALAGLLNIDADVLRGMLKEKYSWRWRRRENWRVPSM